MPIPKKKTLASVIGAAAAAGLLTFTSFREGLSLHPYEDPLAGHVQTVCYGETNTEMRTYTSDECKDLLNYSLAGYAERVSKLTPGFDSLTDGQKVAIIDLAYNIGLRNYERSTIRKLYAIKDFPAACEAFLDWRYVKKRDCSIKANGCSGIWTRRQGERALCRGAP
jgi:lysozyme